MLLDKLSPAPPPVREQADDYPLFDWLRFILASVVALFHTGVITWGHAGNLAVQVFFALSGLLIGGILLKSSSHDLPRFFYNRATRIWIPYFFAVAILYALSTAKDAVNLRWLEFLFYDITFTHNWFALRPDFATAVAEMPLRGTGNHFWSISVEEQFYLLAPLIIIGFAWGRTPRTWLAIAAILMALRQTDFASISLGLFLATLPAGSLKAVHRHWLGTAAITSLAAISLVPLSCSYEANAPYFAPIFSVAIITLCATTGVRTSTGIFVGGISYPVYLNHWIGIFAANAIAKIVTMPMLLTGLLGYVGGVLAGTLAYLMIDRIVMANRARFFRRERGIGLAAAAYMLLATGLIFGTIRWSHLLG